MIIKHFEIKKLNFEKNNLVLLYGKNEGLKKEILSTIINNTSTIITYEENEIIHEKNLFLENVLNKSLFEEKKTIIINRTTDKLLPLIEDIFNKNIEDLILLVSNNLEKKSKLRNFFEKNKHLICIPIYPDNNQTLSKLAYEYFEEKKIQLSSEITNQIIRRSFGDRKNLLDELDKVENYMKNGNKITLEKISKLTNLSENYSVSELVDNCLAKNEHQTIRILNENNFSDQDCILIVKTFLNKCKKILVLSTNYKKNRNIDLTISEAKPPIFWKDKEITIQQIYKWSPEKIKELIYKLNNLELLIKKNINNSVNLITDFILEQQS